MLASDLPAKNVPPISPPCPTCGKEMMLTSVTPTCESVIYGYLCSDDGDRLSWQPRHCRAEAAISANSTRLE
jgi:hypothetical protein